MEKLIFTDKEAGEILASKPKFKNALLSWIMNTDISGIDETMSHLPEHVRTGAESMMRLTLSHGARDLYDFFDTKEIILSVIYNSDKDFEAFVDTKTKTYEIIARSERKDVEKDMFERAINYFENE